MLGKAKKQEEKSEILAEELIGNVRTVQTLNIQEKEKERYILNLIL